MKMLREWEITYKPHPAEATVIKCATLLLVLFYGEPDLMDAITALLGRIAA